MTKRVTSPLKTLQNFNGLDEKGFNLVELLIALTVFTIGILAVAMMQTAAMQGNNFSSSLTMAVKNYNQLKAEQFLSMAYGDSDLDSGAHGPESMTGSNGVVYSRSWLVDVDSPYTGAKTVTISTTWSDLSGTHTVRTAFVKDSSIY
ncbi:MAG: prepilin-type N-terminal cleavage/methylation domain-containing protein [Planctomycetes bacterium]|nr:prepilin-type N-terminal cleavage/methylation domain-containing protein [Planctomycetota bacterium]